jgi:two-component system response regulator RegA
MVKAMSDAPLLLIVDDDPILRRVLEKAMQRRGYEVLTAENVEEAIALSQSTYTRICSD